MHAFAAAGMFHRLTTDCIKGRLNACHKEAVQNCTKRDACPFNWQRPEGLLLSFLLSKTKPENYWTSPNKYMNEHNKAVGIVVSIYFNILYLLSCC